MTHEEVKEFYSDKDLQWFYNKFKCSSKHENLHSISSFLSKISHVKDTNRKFRRDYKYSESPIIEKFFWVLEEICSTHYYSYVLSDTDKGISVPYDYRRNFEELCRESDNLHDFNNLVFFVLGEILVDWVTGSRDIINMIYQERCYRLGITKSDEKEIFIILEGIYKRTKVWYIPYSSVNKGWEIFEGQLNICIDPVYLGSPYLTLFISDNRYKQLLQHTRGNVFLFKKDIRKLQETTLKTVLKKSEESIKRLSLELEKKQKQLDKVIEDSIWLEEDTKYKLGMEVDDD